MRDADHGKYGSSGYFICMPTGIFLGSRLSMLQDRFVLHASLFLMSGFFCLANGQGPAVSKDSGSMARHLPVVAVLTFGGNGAGEQELGAVTARFETELMGTDSFTLVERRNIDKILKEQGFQQSGACDTTDCAVQIGQLLSVQSIFTGELTKAGKLWSLQVKRTDVGSSRTQFSQILDIEGSFEEVLRSGVPEMAELASGRKKANRERNVLVAKQASLWPWVLGGGALIGGGTAVYLLTQGSSQSSTAATTGDGSWQTTVRWK